MVERHKRWTLLALAVLVVALIGATATEEHLPLTEALMGVHSSVRNPFFPSHLSQYRTSFTFLHSFDIRIHFPFSISSSYLSRLLFLPPLLLT